MAIDLDQLVRIETNSATADSAAIVLQWPNYSGGNPYQHLLYRNNGLDADCYFGTIDQGISLLKENLVDIPVCFHLHWLNEVFGDPHNLTEAHDKAVLFVAKLREFKHLGGSVVWTVHNELSHEQKFRDAEIFLSEQVALIADKIHLHCIDSLDEITAFDLPNEKVIEYRHGHYKGAYSDFITRAEARTCLGLHAEDDVCLFIGQVRPYKGVDFLLTAFRELRRHRPNLRLLVAGSRQYDFMNAAEPALTEAERAAIITTEYFVEDQALQIYFRAADFAIYPYQRILTSGSVLLSASFGLPFAATETAMIRQLLKSEELGIGIKSPVTEKTVQTALETLLHRKDEGLLRDLSENFEQTHAWGDFTTDVIQPAIQAASDRPKSARLRACLNPPALPRSVRLDEYHFLKNSKAFSAAHFLRTYPMLSKNAYDPAAAYLSSAVNGFCAPNKNFDAQFYRTSYADARASHIDAFTHFLINSNRPANPLERDAQLSSLSKLPATKALKPTVVLFCSRPCDMTKDHLAFITQVLAQEGVDNIHALVSEEFGENLGSARGQLQDVPIHSLTYPDAPYHSAFEVARTAPENAQIILIDMADLIELDISAQCIAHLLNQIIETPQALWTKSKSYPFLAFAIPAFLFKECAPRHRVCDDTNLIGLIAARLRQFAPAVPIYGDTGEHPKFGLTSVSNQQLAQAGAAFLDTDIKQGSPPPPLTLGDAVATSQIFDFTDILAEKVADYHRREALHRINRSAKTQLVKFHGASPDFGGFLTWEYGPQNQLAAPGEAVVFACMKNEEAFLPAFLDHYRKLGARHIILVDDHSEQNVADLDLGPDVTVYKPARGRFLSAKTLWMELLIQRFCPKTSLVVTVDIDELLDLPSATPSFESLEKAMSTGQHTFMLSLLVDLVPKNAEAAATLAMEGGLGVEHLTDMAWQESMTPASYAQENCVKWSFGPYADLSWRIDSRFHSLGTHECLRKVSVFRHLPGLHLNQGFHSLVNRLGRNFTSVQDWSQGPVGFLRHYKFSKFIAHKAKSHTAVYNGVYHRETAENLAKAYAVDSDTLISSLEKMKRRTYSVEALEHLIMETRQRINGLYG